ncbi:ABC transporter substrate-binding protein [Lysobacter korlensis]|uniref:ABC transporter substrate-binding protein n=1 Tax=Lysobacter korlensis TaxID=553636 RepID=A0ABV6RXK8_9GAMM
MRKQILAIPALAVTTALALTGCGGGDGGGAGGGGNGEDVSLLIWTTEDVADRIETQEEMLTRFSDETGIETELVAVAADQLPTVLSSAAASGELPDAIAAASLSSIYQFAIDDLLDTDAAAAVVDALGSDTFSARALELTTSDEGAQLAVPSDGWAQLLYYRSDLFEEAGLDAPETFDDIMEAASTLDSPDLAGITLATAPGDGFTQETFEHIALANGCELVDDAGEVALESPECVGALEFFAEIASEYSVEGNQDVDTTRATYFAGDAAMIIWSSFLLDELAGLRNDALPTCAECEGDPTFLSQNTGIVGPLQGPDASEPAAFGEIVSWAIMADAAPETQDLVEWMMSDAYLDWLAIAPEGKVPTRMGTTDSPTEFADAWAGLEAGVDTVQPLSELYPEEVLASVASAPESFDRWGIPQGYGELAGAVAGQLVMPKLISEMINSGLGAEEAAQQAAEQVTQIKEDLGL